MGNQHAARSPGEVSFKRLVLTKGLRHDGGPSRHHEQLTAKPYESPGGDQKLHPHGADRADLHVSHVRAPTAQGFDDGPLIGRIHLDHHLLNGLEQVTIDFFDDHLGRRDFQFVTFPAHGLDQDREMQLPPPRHREAFASVRFLDFDPHIHHGLMSQAFPNVTGGEESPAILPGQGAGVMGKVHRDGRFINVDRREGRGMLRGGNRFADPNLFDAGQGDNVAGLRLSAFHAAESLVDQEFRHLAPLGLPRPRHQNDGVSHANGPVDDPTDRYAPDIGIVVQDGDQHLEWLVRIGHRRKHPMHDRVQQGLHVLSLIFQIQSRPSFLARGIDDGEVELFIRRVQLAKQIEGLIDDLMGAG